jgi:hypothetical protein
MIEGKNPLQPLAAFLPPGIDFSASDFSVFSTANTDRVLAAPPGCHAAPLPARSKSPNAIEKTCDEITQCRRMWMTDEQGFENQYFKTDERVIVIKKLRE